MRVLITGGIGRVGDAVVKQLVGRGWEVRVIGLHETADIAGAEYTPCDITNYAALREAVRGCEAIVHLAAIPGPTSAAGPEVFRVNVSGTYNVFEAAAAEGIRRVVQASSINAFGCFWGMVDIRPQYLPLDEKHPTFTTDVYSFSKGVIEDIGDYYWRRAGISSVALRFPGVRSAEQLAGEEYQQHRQERQALIDEFAAQPETTRLARLAQIRQATAAYRQQKYLEYPLAKDSIKVEGFSEDPLWLPYNFDRFNFWAYIDERDSAQSLEKGITAEYEGSHALFINAEANYLGYNSATLARLFYPDSQWQGSPDSDQALVSINKAKDLIGFAPLF